MSSSSSAPPTVLARILSETRAEVERRKRAQPEPQTLAAPGPRRGFHAALKAPGICVIAEFKRRSPSAGTFNDEPPSLERTLLAYERGGAAAVSVLTESPNFGGSLQDLADARAVCGLPLLRKDFVVDVYQLHEALAAGADAVLLIVAALEDELLADLHQQATDLGLDALVEVHDEHELERALGVGAELIGVNNRDLRDFSVDVARTESLMDRMPPSATVVSESGIASPAQLARLEGRGIQAVLVGETLMRAADPARALAELRASGAGSESL
ncbi:MAG TPA: indole-3-glycerol phosphate synthase TrpC [Solirubrobacteraceae bacterium]|jgi:indole-3-glycerol phosphate synthase